MNYFPFHIGDYASHTAHLEPMEDLAYRRLMDLYYLREGALPADIGATAKLARMRSMASDVESVLKEFFVLTDAGWVHNRCEVEIHAMQDKQKKQRDKANKRWHKPEAEQGNATASKEDATADAAASKTDADAMPPTPTPTPTPVVIERGKTARGSRLPENFEPDFQFAVDAGIQNTLEEANKFRDYWAAQPGQKGVKLDWSATWRNWCRNAKQTPGKASEPAWRTEQRNRTLQAVPSIAERGISPIEFFDVEAKNVTSIALGR